MPKVCPVCDTTYSDANAFCPVDGTTLHVVDLEGGLIGSCIADRYLVTDLLGEGGMGKVYLARHVRLPQQAAIKVLRPDMVRDAAAVARFNREASNASRIDDEHVARVYDFGEISGGSVYLAMEYVPGRTLKDLVATEGALAPTRAADVVRQIGQGLDAAHRLKIIHRDLKPDNILVTTDPDGRDRVKVVDFGIAKAFGADDGKLTKTGFVVGTPEFMSPEQLLGSQLDARSDVYALALVAYHCLTASLPFAGDTPEQAMTARLTSAPRPLAVLSPNTPWSQSVQAVFDAGLSRDLSKRPESAGAFARMLSAAVAGEKVDGPAPTRAPAAEAAGEASEKRAEPSPTKRWPLVAGVVAVAAVAVVLALQYRPWATTEAPPPAGPSAPDSAGSRDTTGAGPKAVADGRIVTNPPPVADSTPKKRGPPERVVRVVPDSAAVVVAPPSDDREADGTPPVVSNAQQELRNTLDSLTRVVGRRSLDDVTARAAAAALRALAPRLTDPSARARAYFRLIDASVLSGDMTGACAARKGAEASARGAQQLAELKTYDEQLGCGG